VRKPTSVLAGISLAAVVSLVPISNESAFAVAQTVTVNDPIGDTANNGNTNGNGNEKGPAYFDIVQDSVTGDAGTFTLSMRLAAPVPVAPPNPAGNPGYDFWAFAFDTQPGGTAGFPFPPGQGNERPFEQLVFLTWNGAVFHAFLVDRTPLVSGGEEVITDIPFSFNAARDEITFVVNGALIGNATTFDWGSATGLRKAHFGNDGFQVLDVIEPSNWP